MTPFEQLREVAARLRNLNQKKADLEFRFAMRVITELERNYKPAIRRRRQFSGTVIRLSRPDSPYRRMTTIQAGERVLREGKPMALVDLTIEIMNRGHRSADEPRKVMRALRASFDYHRRRFTQDSEGRWEVSQPQQP